MINVRNHFGLPCVVAINQFASDTDAEIELLKKKIAHHERRSSSPSTGRTAAPARRSWRGQWWR